MAIMKDVKIGWAKIIGAPRPKFNPKEGNEWSVDMFFTKDQIKELKSEGYTAEAFLKKAKDTGETFVKYSRDEVKKDGTPNNPLKVVGPDGKTPWPQDKLLGNGTVVNINYKLTDPYKVGKEVRTKLVVFEVQIVEHVPYESKGGFEAVATTPKTEEEWG